MLKLNQNYSDYTDETDENYPEGKAINASSSESFDGTPLLAEFMNDINAAHIAMYKKAYGNTDGISEIADTQKVSQFADAVAKYTDDKVKSHADERGLADGVHGATSAAASGQIASRDEYGNLKVGTAINDEDAINKGDAEAMVKNLGFYAQSLFDIFIPEIYVQLPGMKDPNEKYNNDYIKSTWEEIKFGGVFFRSVGGDALPYTGNFKCVVAGNSISLNSSDLNTMQYETLLATYEADKLIVIAGGEYRSVTAWDRTTHTITLDSAFTDYSNITNVLIGQVDQYQGHWHGNGTTSGLGGVSSTSAQGFPNVDGGIYTNRQTVRNKNSITDDVNGIPRVGKETRGKNVTVIYWKRTA